MELKNDTIPLATCQPHLSIVFLSVCSGLLEGKDLALSFMSPLSCTELSFRLSQTFD